MTRVIGLISGTSVDGIDAVLVDISGTTVNLQVTLLAGETYPYSPLLREEILEVIRGKPITLAELARLDEAIAREFAAAAMRLERDRPPVNLIGSHGQTVYHQPPHETSLGYSLQLGRGDTIARMTGIPTITNFRAADIAAGGQGAPLVPRVDAYLLAHPTQDRCVQNLGGISNLAYLPAREEIDTDTWDSIAWEQRICGWDTGPGNSLLDLAVTYLSQGKQTYDKDGAWAAQGTPHMDLVDLWMQHPYFHQHPPKSTGRELFGWEFCQKCLEDARDRALEDADILATLTELTVVSTVESYRQFLPKLPDVVLLCGGGSRNSYLKQRFALHLGEIALQTTNEAGVNANFKEAIAFAVLAYWRRQGIYGNIKGVTGACQSVLLGDLHPVFPQ